MESSPGYENHLEWRAIELHYAELAYESNIGTTQTRCIIMYSLFGHILIIEHSE